MGIADRIYELVKGLPELDAARILQFAEAIGGIRVQVTPAQRKINLALLAFVLPVTADIAPVRPWEFIVIHHSATRVGNAEAFDARAAKRGGTAETQSASVDPAVVRC
mgnify:CR=1 FL=1